MYGEIYGSGIQKGYNYGLPEGEHGLVLFDVMACETAWRDAAYLDWAGVVDMAKQLRLKTVPVIYQGPFAKALVKEWEGGPSLIGWYPNDEIINNEPAQPVREGVVIKAKEGDRKVLRAINPEYLLKEDNTDFH